MTSSDISSMFSLLAIDNNSSACTSQYLPPSYNIQPSHCKNPAGSAAGFTFFILHQRCVCKPAAALLKSFLWSYEVR